MKTRFLLSTAICLATAAPASAATAYLSPTGSGTTCSLAAPCVSMTSAISAAGLGGDVICLARGPYSGFIFVNITQSVTISCGDGLWQGTGTALTINPPAGSRVVIEGFVSDGQASVNNINFTGQGSLDLFKVRVSNNVSTDGLSFRPNGDAQLRVSDSVFLNSQSSGIFINPTAGTTKATILNTISDGGGESGLYVLTEGSTKALVTLNRFSASNNTRGLRVGNAGSQVTVHESAFNNNGSQGVFSSGPVSLTRSTSSGNLIGVHSVYSSGVVTLAESRVFGNTTGLTAVSGGQILTFGNNEVNGNTTDGVATAPPIALK